jgi:hypothetical protein
MPCPILQVTKARAAKPKRNRPAPKNIVRVVQEREEAGVVSRSYAVTHDHAAEDADKSTRTPVQSEAAVGSPRAPSVKQVPFHSHLKRRQ